MKASRDAALALAAALTASCAHGLPKLPTAPGTPARDMAAAMAQATSSCSDTSMTVEIAASGRVAGRRFRARLLAGFAPGDARLEAVAPFGEPFFILVSHRADATLLLPRDARVLEHAPADAVLEAIAGIRLDPGDLSRVLTACKTPDRLVDGVAIGDTWRTAAGDGGSKLFLHRDSSSGPWRVAAMLFPGEALKWSWRADYADYHDGHPLSIRLTSEDGKRFDLQLALSQLEIGAHLDAQAFRVRVPPSAVPITLDELKQSGPFGPTASRSDER